MYFLKSIKNSFNIVELGAYNVFYECHFLFWIEGILLYFETSIGSKMADSLLDCCRHNRHYNTAKFDQMCVRYWQLYSNNYCCIMYYHLTNNIEHLDTSFCRYRTFSTNYCTKLLLCCDLFHPGPNVTPVTVR